MKDTKDLRKFKILFTILLSFIFLSVFIAFFILFPSNNNINPSDSIQISEVPKPADTVRILENNEYMHVETDSEGINVPVPNGYIGSSVAGENSINSGYVIYEGSEAVTSANVDSARKTRNQYVWVPVPDTSKIYGIDNNGKKWGKLYNFSSSSGDEITGTRARNWKETNNVMTVSNKSSYREPDVVKSSDKDSNLITSDFDINNMHDFLLQIEFDFETSIKCIEKYGGFYIGRYETGGLDATAKVVKGDSQLTSQTWYSMYQNCKNLKGTNHNIITNMIWGFEYDRTLMWLIESGNKSKDDIAVDSERWGNYSNVSLSFVNSSGNTVTKSASSKILIPSGSSETTKANNIYDLAGNVSEWTLEANSTTGRITRGGSYSTESSSQAAYYYTSSIPTRGFDNNGCRAVLYIKF